MEPRSRSYTIEKLTTAVDCLVTHPGDVRERLACAFLSFHTLTENDFSPELRSDWRWVMNQLTRYGPLLNHNGEAWMGSVENTMRRVRRSTGVKIAKRIYQLYWDVSENKQYL